MLLIDDAADNLIPEMFMQKLTQCPNLISKETYREREIGGVPGWDNFAQNQLP